MELKICKIREIHAIGVKSMDLVVTWLNKFCLENFVGKWSKLVRSMGHVAIGMNEISSGEFRVFFSRKDGHLCLWVLPWKFVSNEKCSRVKFVQFVL